MPHLNTVLVTLKMRAALEERGIVFEECLEGLWYSEPACPGSQTPISPTQATLHSGFSTTQAGLSWPFISTVVL
jgi:hypothetical protein